MSVGGASGDGGHHRWTAGLTTTTVVDGGAKVHDAMLEISCAKTQSAGSGRSMRTKAQLYISGERSTKLLPELEGASVSIGYRRGY